MNYVNAKHTILLYNNLISILIVCEQGYVQYHRLWYERWPPDEHNNPPVMKVFSSIYPDSIRCTNIRSLSLPFWFHNVTKYTTWFTYSFSRKFSSAYASVNNVLMSYYHYHLIITFYNYVHVAVLMLLSLIRLKFHDSDFANYASSEDATQTQLEG